MAKNNSLALRAVPRDNLEKMTMQLRRRARNEKMQMDRLVGRAIATAGSAGGAAAMGALVGSRLRQNKSTTMPVIGGDLELWIAAGAILIGGAVQVKTKKTGTRIAGEFLEGSGNGVLAYWAGSKAEAMAMKGSTVAP